MANPFRVDWAFIMNKGFRNSFLDRILPSHMIRTTRTDGLNFYHYKALPPQNTRFLEKNREFYEVLLNLKGNIAVDIGANIGSYSLRLARNFRWVFAFEPNPLTNRLLNMNVKRNRIENIDVLNAAVSDGLGGATLRIPTGKEYGSTISDKHYDWLNFDTEVNVSTTDLDSFFGSGISKVDLVKIDVEGHEMKVLEGMEQVIKHHHPILSVEVHREADSREACNCPVCSWLSERYHSIRGKYDFGKEAHWLLCQPDPEPSVHGLDIFDGSTQTTLHNNL